MSLKRCVVDVLGRNAFQICATTVQLDTTLRVTCSFWSDFLPSFSPHWISLLHQYAYSSVPFSLCSASSTHDFFYATITYPNSAPSVDGLPYARRVCPSICLNQHFLDIIFRKVRPPQQSLVFKLKADQGEYAGNYGSLGLSNTCNRIIDRAAYFLFCQTLINSLHPAQTLLNMFREPQYNILKFRIFLLRRTTKTGSKMDAFLARQNGYLKTCLFPCVAFMSPGL